MTYTPDYAPDYATRKPATRLPIIAAAIEERVVLIQVPICGVKCTRCKPGRCGEPSGHDSFHVCASCGGSF